MEHLNTVSITDYEINAQVPTLAKVIISYTGKFNKDSIRASLRSQLDNLAVPVEDSFREVKAGVAVGFLRANKELRVVEAHELRANYRTMGSSNIMMSEVDNSLWEVKQGKGGTYLARHGNEDLSDLVSASVQRRTDVPGLRHLSMAKAAQSEFAAFVNKSGDMDYGFVIAGNNDKIQVVSTTQHVAVVVDYSMVTSIQRVPVPKSFAKKMATAGISTKDKTQAKEYWTQLYSYDPPYLKDVIQQVDEGTVA